MQSVNLIWVHTFSPCSAVSLSPFQSPIPAGGSRPTPIPISSTAQMTGQDTNKPTHNCTSLITEGVWVSWRTLGCEDAQSKSPWGIQIEAKHQNPSAVLKTKLQMRAGGRKGFPPSCPAQNTPGKAPASQTGGTQGQRL